MISAGLALSVLVAMLRTGKDSVLKVTAGATDEYLSSLFLRFVTAAVVLGLLVAWGVPFDATRQFYVALAVNTVLFAAYTLLSVRALDASDISIVAPIAAFSPALVLATAWALNGEVPTHLGGVGVLVIVAGAYALNLNEVNVGVAEPLRVLVDDRGARLMMAAVLVSALIPPIDKLGIQASSPLVWAMSINLAVALVMVPLVLRRSAEPASSVRAEWRWLLLAGGVNAALWVAQTFAYEMTLVVYVSAVKKFSIPLAVVVGYWFFDESNIRHRLLGAGLMVVGVLLIIFGG